MIVGSGQLASIFFGMELSNVIIFASGVSNSSNVEKTEFTREKELLVSTIEKNRNAYIIYFSSASLSAEGYKRNEYYEHKRDMENLLSKTCNKYIIVRLPQVFGQIKRHHTIINYLFYKIVDGEELTLYNDSYRYLIDIIDVRTIVTAFLKHKDKYCCSTLNVGNPYHYSVMGIVKVMENILKTKANCTIVDKSDKYVLNFNEMNELLKSEALDIGFGKDYFEERFSKYIKMILG